MTTYLLMALLTAAALLLLTRPWWQRSGTHLQRRAANVAAYRSRVEEIGNDAAAGLLDADAAEQLKQEAGARLLGDAETVEPGAGATASRTWLLPLLMLPLFAGAWYFNSGGWRTQQLIELAASDPAAAQSRMIEGMVQRLEQRLQKNPDDAEGWAMLGRSRAVLKQFQPSADAYARANQLSASTNADWLVGEGESLAMARDRDLSGKPKELFDAAVKLQSDHVAGLWFAGLSAMQMQDYERAHQLWTLLAKLELPGDMREIVDRRVQELAEVTGKAPIVLEPSTPAGAALELEVSLAPELRSALRPDQVLFVFAKAEQGPPMPLAVQKMLSPQLPLKVRLDDSMAMMPSLKMSQFPRWVITARISAGASVKAQSGDLEGSLLVDRSQASRPQQLVISRRVP